MQILDQLARWTNLRRPDVVCAIALLFLAPAFAEPAPTMTKHTPGPWGISGDRFDIRGQTPEGGAVFVARMYDVPEHPLAPADPEMLANAHLIAAAPDLLQTAEAALETLEEWWADRDDGGGEEASMSMLRRAIAQAKHE